MGMINPVDKKLSFGEAVLKDASACPDTLSLNNAQTERMKVEVSCTEDAAGGTSIALQLEGSDNGTSFAPIGGAQTVVLASLKEGNTFTLPIPDGVNKKFLKVTCAKTGTFTAGKIAAYLDTYLGI